MAIQFPENDFRQKMIAAYRMDETECVQQLISSLNISAKSQQQIADFANQLILNIREKKQKTSGIESLMRHYDLSTDEGILLMCLAEALLRIPDKYTEDLLIREKLTSANWEMHLGQSESAFVNMATRGLAFSGKILASQEEGFFLKTWRRLVQKTSEPIIREAVRKAIKVMSEQFVLGRTINEALKNSKALREQGYTFSFDMLGEVARTEEDADRYFQAYYEAIVALGKNNRDDVKNPPSISVKLSALHPRYEFTKYENVVAVLTEKIAELALLAKDNGIDLTIDAEESDKLDMSLDIFANVLKKPEFSNWNGLGLAVQAYQKRAFYVIQWLIELGRTTKHIIPVRLVKGAYWDTEIKLSQVGGFESYPVFTRKAATDISYLACAKVMLAAQDAIYPQFATHNAQTVSAIINLMDDNQQYQFEFQRLQGMGKALHDQIVDKSGLNILSRIYAPVGSHKDLLPYLVRRLLENGANSSFVNQLAHADVPIEELIEDPVIKIESFSTVYHDKIPLPKDIYGKSRRNSQGVDISNLREFMTLTDEIKMKAAELHYAAPFNQFDSNKNSVAVTNPADHSEIVGYCNYADEQDVDVAIQNAQGAFNSWNALGFSARAEILVKVSDLIESHRAELIALAQKEAGKVLADGISEVREATDLCRYYAKIALENLQPHKLPGPTGESNQLLMEGRGIMACISPWNFPIAIFTGQIAAGLVTGNTVIAKPSLQTPLVAGFVVDLFYQAGVPKDVLQLLPGKGSVIGEKLVQAEQIAGVIFTGSTETAQNINQKLAKKTGPIATLIAETGGINAMIADSTALAEQLVADVISSAFGSAGQRCSALRVLFLQEDIAEHVITMLQGAILEIRVGDPTNIETDVGPVIDNNALKSLEQYAEEIAQKAELIAKAELPKNLADGSFIAPQAYLLPDASLVTREVFGPILHVVCYQKNNLDAVIDSINNLGYGLTFGIHSRINTTINYVTSRIRAGNIYINRNMIGAVVGVQPFGGMGLSGTGPKAGGPHYLTRLCQEKSIANNIVAMGGNATLMMLT